jgi:hypothetical protein
MILDWDKVKDVRELYAQAYTRYMNGNLTWEEFEPIKKEWGSLSAELGRVMRKQHREIEKDLLLKYGQDRYKASL